VLTEGYMVLFDRVRAYMKLPFKDLTFANFSGIQVPRQALIAE
jgi:hypothetical protein